MVGREEMDILGFPDWLFMLLAALGISITGFISMLILWFLTPGNGRKLLSARLKKTGLLAVFGKATLRFVKVKNLAPGWVETDEGKKYIWPIPPKQKIETWSPERDVLSKVEHIDGIPVLTVYEAEALAVNADTLATAEASAKGYDAEQLPFPLPEAKPERWKILIPVNPKVLTETLRSMVTTEHIDVFEQHVIEVEEARKRKGEWAPIIKIGIIIGAITIVAIIAMLLVKSAVFG